MLRSASLPALALFSMSLHAAQADVGDVVACADRQDDRNRLACYDAAVAKLKTELAETHAKGATLFGLPIPFTGPRTEEEFGKPPAPPPETRAVTEISARLVGWTKDPLGHAILTLDNGQVWKVIEFRPVLISTAGTTSIRIERRAMGGYYMSVNGADSNLTVARLR